MTRRTALGLLTLPVARLAGESKPEGFRVYTDAPRLFLRPQRLRLLRRERERKSLRWEQFDLLWTGNAPFPELGWAGALRYQIAQDESAGRSALSWASNAGAADIRQIALIADWCAPLMTKADQSRIYLKLQKAASGPPPKTIAEARNMVLAGIAISEAQPDIAERALRNVYENFWMASYIPAIGGARIRVPNADACAMIELLHAFRDNLNFDLRESLPAWFKQYPVIHLAAHYPAPWPASENEFHIPADPEIQKKGPDLVHAALSRAAELAMVAYDSNAPETQLLQGFLMNDRFLMRGPFGIPYEMLWANPYQPGLSYYHVPLAQHDEIGGQLFVRSSWEDDASWIGFFEGQLQLFSEGSVTQVDPRLAHEPMDIEEATVFFARDAKQFQVPSRASEDASDAVFIVGLEPRKPYHIEVDGREMVEELADPGGIVFLPNLPPDAQVRIAPKPLEV
jgi:hypothetical protein